MVCTPFPCWFVIETNPLEFTPHRLYRPVLTRNSTSHNNDRIKKIMLDPVASHHAVTMAYCFDLKTRADIFFFLSSTCFLHLMTYWRVPIIAQHGHMRPKLSSSQKKCSDNQHKVSSTKFTYLYMYTDLLLRLSTSLLCIEEGLVPPEASHLLNLHHVGRQLVSR